MMVLPAGEGSQDVFAKPRGRVLWHGPKTVARREAGLTGMTGTNGNGRGPAVLVKRRARGRGKDRGAEQDLTPRWPSW
jgi:hypothetical protein